MKLTLARKLDKPIPWILGLLAVGVLGISSATYLVINRPLPKSEIAELTVPVKAENLTVLITASGTVQPIQSVNLSPKTAGRLAELYVEQGDPVKQGQIIARMDNAAIQAQLLQGKARLAQAQAKYTQARTGSRPEEISQARAQVEAAQASVNLTNMRVKRYGALAREGAISQDRLDEVVTDDSSAKASLKEAQRRLEQLLNGTRQEEIASSSAEVEATRGELQATQVQQEDTIIRAPFSGIVMQKYATEGAFVTPTTSASSTASATSTSIVSIARGLEILAKVPEVDIGRIKRGQSVEIVADAYPDQVFQGRVERVAPEAVVEQNVTSFQVRVKIETGETRLQSGMNVDVTFLGEGINNALVVPTVAIATQDGQTGVYVPDAQNQPQFRSVTIGPTIKDQTQILKGLSKGESVFLNLPERSASRMGGG